jgi:hypothetical protein
MWQACAAAKIIDTISDREIFMTASRLDATTIAECAGGEVKGDDGGGVFLLMPSGAR